MDPSTSDMERRQRNTDIRAVAMRFLMQEFRGDLSVAHQVYIDSRTESALVAIGNAQELEWLAGRLFHDYLLFGIAPGDSLRLGGKEKTKNSDRAGYVYDRFTKVVEDLAAGKMSGLGTVDEKFNELRVGLLDTAFQAVLIARRLMGTGDESPTKLALAAQLLSAAGHATSAAEARFDPLAIRPSDAR